jgi:hypothetical protein
MRRDFSLTEEPTLDDIKELTGLFARNPVFLGFERNEGTQSADIIVGLNGPKSEQKDIIRIDGYTLERLWDWADIKDLFTLATKIQALNDKISQSSPKDLKEYGSIMNPLPASGTQGYTPPSPT